MTGKYYHIPHVEFGLIPPLIDKMIFFLQGSAEILPEI